MGVTLLKEKYLSVQRHKRKKMLEEIASGTKQFPRDEASTILFFFFLSEIFQLRVATST